MMGILEVPLQGGYHTHTQKHEERVVFHERTMYKRTVQRVSKLQKSGEKGILLLQSILEKGIFSDFLVKILV